MSDVLTLKDLLAQVLLCKAEATRTPGSQGHPCAASWVWEASQTQAQQRKRPWFDL